ncbi:UNVERIFIED_CONTAM: hypothetical protein HHA_216055 [Hammondia hammondi]|eukprot:XP_008886349.1 hypothetical protein HHA_216055 [Hammondia hammondi]
MSSTVGKVLCIIPALSACGSRATFQTGQRHGPSVSLHGAGRLSKALPRSVMGTCRQRRPSQTAGELTPTGLQTSGSYAQLASCFVRSGVAVPRSSPSTRGSVDSCAWASALLASPPLWSGSFVSGQLPLLTLHFFQGRFMKTAAEKDPQTKSNSRRPYSPKVRWLAEQLVSLSQEEADSMCSSLKERMTAVSNTQSGDQKGWTPQTPGNFTYFPHPLGIFAATTGSLRVVGVGMPRLPALAMSIIHASRQDDSEKTGASETTSPPVKTASESAADTSAPDSERTSQVAAGTSP